MISARPARGMTLIEVMMAFAILVTGLVSVFALLSAGMRTHKRAINETEAGLLAASLLDETRADFFNGKDVSTDVKDNFTESKDSPGYQYNRKIVSLEPARTGAIYDSANREFYVRVEVRWSEQGENKSVAVDTIMFCNRRKSKTSR